MKLDYPIDINQDAQMKYHIQSAELFQSAIVFDEHGVPKNDYGKEGLGVQYNPAYIGWYALSLLNDAQDQPDQEQKLMQKFWQQIEWMKHNTVERKIGEESIYIWEYNFDYAGGKYRTILKAPWYSAMAQGLIISALVRAHRIDSDGGWLELAMKGMKCFGHEVKGGGVKVSLEGRGKGEGIDKGFLVLPLDSVSDLKSVLYEEYPVYPYASVLDGFLFALLGLFDLYQETKDQSVKKLLDEGLLGLETYLPRWNFINIWSYYGSHGILSNALYNTLNYRLLEVVQNKVRPIQGFDKLKWLDYKDSLWFKIFFFGITKVLAVKKIVVTWWYNRLGRK